MNIQWFYPSVNLPMITIASYGITFNIGAIKYLKYGKSIALGCDINKGKVFIKIEKNGENNGFIIPNFDENRKTLRVNCKDFIQYLETKFKLDTSTTNKFYLEFVEDEDMFTFNLNEVIKDKKNTKKNKGGVHK